MFNFFWEEMKNSGKNTELGLDFMLTIFNLKWR